MRSAVGLYCCNWQKPLRNVSHGKGKQCNQDELWAHISVINEGSILGSTGENLWNIFISITAGGWKGLLSNDSNDQIRLFPSSIKQNEAQSLVGINSHWKWKDFPLSLLSSALETLSCFLHAWLLLFYLMEFKLPWHLPPNWLCTR